MSTVGSPGREGRSGESGGPVSAGSAGSGDPRRPGPDHADDSVSPPGGRDSDSSARRRARVPATPRLEPPANGRFFADEVQPDRPPRNGSKQPRRSSLPADRSPSTSGNRLPLERLID